MGEEAGVSLPPNGPRVAQAEGGSQSVAHRLAELGGGSERDWQHSEWRGLMVFMGATVEVKPETKLVPPKTRACSASDDGERRSTHGGQDDAYRSAAGVCGTEPATTPPPDDKATPLL